MLADSLTVGIIQFRTRPGEVEENLAETSELISSAKKQGAEVVVLPEMWPTGYGDIPYRDLSAPIPGRYSDFLSENAIRHKMHIVAGIPEREAKEIHNCAVLVDEKGRIVGKHRKIHLYRPVGEDKIWRAGDTFTVLDTRIGRIGLLICYDGDFPESWRVNTLMGAEIIFHVNAYETPCEDWWNKFYPTAALQNAVWIVQCNSVGDTKDKVPKHFFGDSRIIAPDGRIVAEAPYVPPGGIAESYLLIKRIALRKEFEEARRLYGNFLRDRRPETYGPVTSKINR